MKDDKNINYSAVDIDRYMNGQMTAKEMHALEKAALDDPFLADAIEGYTGIPRRAVNDMDLLNDRLNKRINSAEKGRILPMGISKFAWIRIAALFIIVAGAGWFTYQYALRNHSNPVANTTERSDTANRSIVPPLQNDSLQDSSGQSGKAAGQNPVGKTAAAGKSSPLLPSSTETRSPAKTSDTVVNEPAKGLVAAPQPSVAAAAKEEEPAPLNDNKAATRKKLDASKNYSEKQQDVNVNPENITTSDDRARKLKEVVARRNMALQNDKTNIFRGQVLDGGNSPLPFANITNIEDSVGTYADVKGNFVLISPDSVLNVRVRSVGYENSTAHLNTKLANNPIVLQPDTKSVPATVLNNRKINTEKKQQDNQMKFEEPEPADGWYNYDTYIANNIKITDEIKTKAPPSSAVELSFDINKYGEPANIKVEKSVCKECDEEVIRLLKEGPKWKKNKKKQRAKVTVSFLPEDR